MAASGHPRATPSRSQASPSAVQNARRATSNRGARHAGAVLDVVQRHHAGPVAGRFRLERPGARDDAGPIEAVVLAQHPRRAVEHPRALGRVLPEQPVEARMVVEPRMRLDRERDRREKRAAPVLGAPEPLRNRMDDVGADAGARRHRRMERADPVRVVELHRDAGAGAQAEDAVLENEGVLRAPRVQLAERRRLDDADRIQLRSRPVQGVPVPPGRLVAHEHAVHGRIVGRDRQGVQRVADRPGRDARRHARPRRREGPPCREGPRPRAAASHSLQSAASSAGSNSRKRGCVSARCQANQPPSVSPYGDGGSGRSCERTASSASGEHKRSVCARVSTRAHA